MEALGVLSKGLEASSFSLLKRIRRPENHEASCFALKKAMSAQLQLIEVYGVAAGVLPPNRLTLDLFQALLSLESVTMFF